MIDPLTRGQVAQLTAIADAMLEKLDPDGTMAAVYERYDRAAQRSDKRGRS